MAMAKMGWVEDTSHEQCPGCIPHGEAGWTLRARTMFIRGFHTPRYGRVQFRATSSGDAQLSLDVILSLREACANTFGRGTPRYVVLTRARESKLDDAHCERLEELDLHSIHIRDGCLADVSEVLSTCVTLKNLSFRNNRLTRFPSVERMTHLREVDLSGNRLREAPRGISKLQHLVRLSMRDNLLETIPRFECTSTLYVLDLSGNNIEHLPDLNRYPLLYVLDVSRNRIRYLPQSVSCLKQLEYLNVGGNLLRALPTLLWRCSNLMRIVAKDNPLLYIPRSLCRAPRLRHVILGKSQHLLDPPSEVIHGWHAIRAYMGSFGAKEHWSAATHGALPPTFRRLVESIMLMRLYCPLWSSIPLEVLQVIFTEVLNSHIED